MEGAETHNRFAEFRSGELGEPAEHVCVDCMADYVYLSKDTRRKQMPTSTRRDTCSLQEACVHHG